MSLKKTLKNYLPQKFVYNYNLTRYDNHIVSYPKSGRTWLRMLIGYYFNEYYKLNLDISEISLTGRLHKFNKNLPKIYFSHLGHPQLTHYKKVNIPFLFLKNKNIIFLMRNPIDTAVSYYYHFSYRGEKIQSENINFKGSLDDFVLGSVGGVTSIVNYYNSWIKFSKKEKVLFLKYEKLKNKTELILKEILDNLNVEIIDKIVSDSVLFCNSDNLKKLEEQNKLNKYHFGGNNSKNRKVRNVGKKKYNEILKSSTIKTLESYINDNLEMNFYRF